MAHTWIGDLEIILRSPGGTVQHQIVNRIGVTAGGFGDSSEFGGTYVFSDAATGNIWTVATAAACGDTCVVAPGAYRTTSAGSGTPTNFTAAFAGLTPAQANGTWTLTFRDAGEEDTGTVTAASLTIDPTGGTPTTPTPTPTATATPTATPTGTPTGTPTATPTATPTGTPTATPTGNPTATPTATPTPNPGVGGNLNLTVFGVTTANQLVRFNAGALTTVGTITGLQAGEQILGIDFRPATGQLYGLGSTSRLYIINILTGAATQVGAAGAFTLSGTNFGFDFNPTVDRIRVVSDTGQNLRLNPNDGTLSATDPNLNGAATGADAAAYTNSFGGATTTTLYDINSTTDTLYIQNPANAGTLVTVGSLGVDASAINGFDISNTNNTALAAFQTPASLTSGLYRINLTTGAATLIGSISGAPLRGLAIRAGSTASNTLDFSGEGRADYSVFRFSNNFIYASRGDGSLLFAFPFGVAGDIFTPGDYDGDGRTDIAVFRPSTGVFFVSRSSDNTTIGFQFGAPGDEPVARDYDGDGRTDYAVVRRSGGVITWFIRNSATGTVTATNFGAESDTVVPGDYDGDGRFDLAVFRGNGSTQAATFFVQRSSGGFTATNFGLGSDLVAPGDYDGDGRTDFAVVRTGTSFDWYILRSSDGALQFDRLGRKSFLTVQNDYDGDGRTDVAVYDPGTGTFFVRRSSDFGLTQLTFGQNGDYPIANFDTH
jgi:subtilisin-like proprotein convertase family protein